MLIITEMTNCLMCTLNTITIFYRDVGDVETVLKASLIREASSLIWPGLEQAYADQAFSQFIS